MKTKVLIVLALIVAGCTIKAASRSLNWYTAGQACPDTAVSVEGGVEG